MAKPPSSLPPTTGAPLLVTLLIGTPDYSPLSADLFDLYVPPSQPAPVHPEEASFHPLPEIQHTFRPEQKLPLRPISAFFALAVLAPWTVLLTLVGFVPTLFRFVDHASLVVRICTATQAPVLTLDLPIRCDTGGIRR